MSAEPTPVRVLFRVDRSGDHRGTVTAVFDDRDEWPMLTCYEHVGQHGSASLEWMLNRTRAAYPSEYAPLLSELVAIGYAVTIGKRLTRYYR